MSGRTLEQLRELISHACGLETAVATVAGDDARSGGGALPAALSAHAAWRLGLWHERWPAPVQSGGRRLVAEVEAESSTDVGTLLERLRELYRATGEHVDPDLDGPTARVLELVTSDVERDLGRLSEQG